jgi:RNA polymerase sigma factor (sigma-70 family)
MRVDPNYNHRESDKTSEFSDLLAAVSEQDHDATARLWQLVKVRLNFLANKEIHVPHRLFGVEDVVMIVFASLYRSLTSDNHQQIGSYIHLQRRLAVMTKRVVIDLLRHEKRLRRGGRGMVNHEFKLDEIAGNADSCEAQIEFSDEVVNLISSLGRRELAELLIARMEGRSYPELAKFFDCSVRTIERRMAQIRTVFISQDRFDSR